LSESGLVFGLVVQGDRHDSEEDAMTPRPTPGSADRTEGTPAENNVGVTGTSAPVTPIEDQLLTTAEVALMLRLPCATLRTWRYQGIGPRSFHLGPRGIRYKRSDVAIWVDRQYGATG
jgi:predicted DNA-binding transcriptional regulator AlpA